MPANTDDVVWVDVLPSLAGFTPKLRAGLKGATTEASASGASAGRAFGTSFGTNAAAAIDSAAARVAAAQKRAADAAGRLTVAQSRLTEVYDSGTASATKVAAAEEAVAKAQRNVTLQTDQVAAAQKKQALVQADVSAAAAAAADKQAVLTARTKESGIASRAFSGTLGTLHGTLGMVSQAMTGLPGLAVGAGLFEATKAASQFNASMLLIQTQAGASAAEVAKMTPAVLALSGKVAQAPEELALSMYHVESTGLRETDALKAVTAAAEGARVGHADLEQTTNALTATIASGMVPATETYAQAMGKLNVIVGSGDMKMQDLNDAMSTGVLVTVKQYGVTLNDVGAALADFGDNNLRGADAATRLRMAVQAIASPSVKAGEVLKQIGLSVKQLQSDQETGGLNKAITDLHQHLVDSGIAASQWGTLLTDAFTKKAGAGVLTLIGTFDRFKQKYTEVSHGADSFGTAWKATTKSAAFQFAALRDRVDVLGIRIGNFLLPQLAHVSSWLTSTGIPAVEGFGSKVSSLFHSPAVSGFESTVTHLFDQVKSGASAVIPIIGALAGDVGHLVSSFVSSGGLSSAATVVGGAFSGLVAVFRGVASVTLPAVSGLVHAFGELSGPVQAVVVAFVALRAASAAGWLDLMGVRALIVGDALKKMATTAVASLGTMKGAYKEAAAQAQFLSTVQGDTSGLAKARGALAGLGSAAGAAAKGGLSALKSGASGLMSMFGGPWGVVLLGAAAVVGELVSETQKHNEQVKADTQSVTEWYKAIRDGGQPAIDAMNNVKNKQAEVNAAQAYLLKLQNEVPSGARGAASALANAVAIQKAHVQDLEGELTKGKKAADDLWNAMTPQQQIAATVAADEANLADAINKHASAMKIHSLSATYQADLAKQHQLDIALGIAEQTLTDKMNQNADAQLAGVSSTLAATQAQSQLSDAIGQYNTDAHDGQHSTKQLADASNALASQAIQTAQAVGKATSDQITATGAVDDGTAAHAAMLKVLQDAAKHIVGPGHDAIMTAIHDMGKYTVSHDNVRGSVVKMGIQIDKTWNANTVILKSATKDQIAQLVKLGDSVTSLPDGRVVVTSNTKPAQDEINKMLADYGHRALNLEAYITGKGGSNGATIGNKTAQKSMATGGLFRGVGTGTSDSNLVAVSDGEFIVKAAATQANLGLLHAINSGAIKGFASGGLVGGNTMQVGTASPVVHMDTTGVAHQLAALIAAARAALGSAVSGAPTSVSANAALAQRMGASLGWGSGPEWNAWYALGQRESGWRNTAQNPTSSAYGIAQFLDSTWSTVGISKTSDAATQILGMERYINGRYGDPIGAWAHETKFGWYHDGGKVQGPAGATVPAFVQVDERVQTAPQDMYTQRLVQATIAADRKQGPRTVIYDQREVYAHVDYQQLSRQMAQDQRTSEWLSGG